VRVGDLRDDVLAATRDVTTDPTAQAVLTSIYSDEVLHARLGCRTCGTRSRSAGKAGSTRAAEMLAAGVARGGETSSSASVRSGEVTDAVRTHGLMTPAEERVIFSTCVREVLVPGFRSPRYPGRQCGRRVRRRMGARSLILLVSACSGGGGAIPWIPALAPRNRTPPSRARRSAWRRTSSTPVLASRDAYVRLFDFVAVGEYEILLTATTLNGRLANLPTIRRPQFINEDGTPYPEARERATSATFYKILAQRTVGSGGCKAAEPRTHYGKQLASFESVCRRPPNGDRWRAQERSNAGRLQKLFDGRHRLGSDPARAASSHHLPPGGKGGLAVGVPPAAEQPRLTS